MRILRTSGYRRMPWKNGGGETIEMVVSPTDATLDNFDWRLSMAHVGGSGPFSLFPGIDRTLSVIAGRGLVLHLPERAPVTLDRRCAPFVFAGDITVDSTLVDGPIDDLNVMTRRSRCRHHVTRHTLTTRTSLARGSGSGVVVAIGGTVEIAAGTAAVTLEPADAIVLEADDVTAFTATPQGPAELFVVDIAFDGQR